MRNASVLAMALLLGALLAFGQSVETGSPAIPDRGYKLLRENEDWSFLRDGNLGQDFWDPIKYIPIRNSGDWFTTMGGEAREMWEQIGNDNWGEAPYMNAYLNQRYTLYFDVHFGERVRTFVEFKSGLNSFRIGGPRPIDEKKLDFQAAVYLLRLVLGQSTSSTFTHTWKQLFPRTFRFLSIESFNGERV